MTELEALRKLRDALPRCRPWLKGSGGHREYGTCPRLATYSEEDGFHCCDEHYPSKNPMGYEELPYAAASRGTVLDP